MALKDDISGIKKEIGTEEQFLESVIKSELFIRKYKKPLIALCGVIVVVLVGYYANEFIQDRRISSANKLYNELLENGGDESKLSELKSKDLNLYALLEFQNANGDKEKLSQISNLNGIDPVLKEIIDLQNGVVGENLLRDYKHLLSGYKLLKDGKIDAANAEFDRIPLDSEFKQIALNLKHYNG